MRRYPQPGLSVARRRTRVRMERMVRGRPGRLGRDAAAWPRRSRSRCLAQDGVLSYQQSEPEQRLPR